MNVNPLLLQAKSVLKVPVFPNLYTGKDKDKPDSYITFNYVDERTETHGDDQDLTDKTTITMHHFCKSNQQSHKKALRRFLRQAGFTILSTGELYEVDTGYTHIAVDAYIYGMVDD